MTFALSKLGEAVVEVVSDEALFLAKYESNWAGVYGLPGRRESHLVAALSSHLRHRYGTRCVLDDSFWGCPDTRCDLAVMLEAPPADRWAWIEVKTMPAADANDKLALTHGDFMKLARAADTDQRNLPQAIVVVGYDEDHRRLEPRIRQFAEMHGVHLWTSTPSDDIARVVKLPPSPGEKRYTHAIVGVWAREDRNERILPCGGRCNLVRP